MKIKELITSEIHVDNKNKSIEVVYTNGTIGFFGFDAFDSKKPDYEKGFDILYEYFDSIADEEKEDVDKRLKEVGL